ncbi:nitrate reductase [Tardiphaga alba]|uniref:Nitrate reductase n=1 Tax=Tardiphaga alba TaxID=340268 RepID=A0ABX8ABE3_9BRAD|nr:periplasmic nitrate reductase, NapE protein [Tardiphaga alba]QUS39979.1 nitrate reductase [Tardiphaga alba]
MDQNISPPDQAPTRNSRLSELLVFLTIIVFIWPVVAVGIVGGYGFSVWIFQMIFGPPGPPSVQ